MWGALKQNVTFGLRTLVKSPGFALTAVLTLALGIGATTAMFSVVYAVFEPMPYPKPDQLVMVWARMPAGRNSVPAGDFFEWRQRSTSFQALHAWSGVSFNITGGDSPEQVAGSRRTPGFFTMEGLPLLYGRDFLPEEGEPGKARVVILSHRLWNRQFASNPDLVGKTIRMNAEPYTVVGIMPPGMHDRFNSQFWIPLTFRPEELTHDSNFAPVMARLKDGVTIEQAQAEMNGIAAQLQNEFPKTNANRNISVEPLHLNFVTDSTRRNLWLLLGAVGFLLLIGCVNVANLAVRTWHRAAAGSRGASGVRSIAQTIVCAVSYREFCPRDAWWRTRHSSYWSDRAGDRRGHAAGRHDAPVRSKHPDQCSRFVVHDWRDCDCGLVLRHDAGVASDAP